MILIKINTTNKNIYYMGFWGFGVLGLNSVEPPCNLDGKGRIGLISYVSISLTLFPIPIPTAWISQKVSQKEIRTPVYQLAHILPQQLVHSVDFLIVYLHKQHDKKTALF